MIKNIVFDFGSVLVDWDPRRVYEPYFGDKERSDYFLGNICTYEWNTAADAGRLTAEITEERVALFPEWEKEIRMYFREWINMMGGQIPGMEEVLKDLKDRGYRLFGLTNWSAETFPLVRNRYPVFSYLEGIVVSGEEKVKKPDPRLYKILLDRYHLVPDECIFIDDNPANIDTANSLGLHGLVFTSPEALKPELEKLLRQ